MDLLSKIFEFILLGTCSILSARFAAKFINTENECRKGNSGSERLEM